jgi:hypothetical protein
MVDAHPFMVLVHSPFLGPSAWLWVARELEQRGRAAVVPSLCALADGPYRPWRDVWETVDAVSAHRAGRVVLVGHSAAGSLLPAIAESPNPARDVWLRAFVDAFLPPPSGTARLVPTEFAEELSALATGGVLAPWSTWFGDEAMRDLVRDGARRARVEQDMPQLPLSVRDIERPYPRAGTAARARTCCSPPSRTRQAPPTRRTRLADRRSARRQAPRPRPPASRRCDRASRPRARDVGRSRASAARPQGPRRPLRPVLQRRARVLLLAQSASPALDARAAGTRPTRNC